ncbi:NUDIX domain-containing protein [Candidatus Pacearchaeota archaeon]|nr:NUDIX domain-containing protein [Candidatus Pacearchaeota archaeon]
MKFRKAVFIVVFAKTNQGIRYLLLKRKLHWTGWEFPKGGIEENESKRSAVERELFEETGKKALRIKQFGFHGSYRYRRKFPERPGFFGQFFSLFAAEIENADVKIDTHEHSTYEWLSFNEAIKKLRFPNQKKSLKIVNNWLSSRN